MVEPFGECSHFSRVVARWVHAGLDAGERGCTERGDGGCGVVVEDGDAPRVEGDQTGSEPLGPRAEFGVGGGSGIGDDGGSRGIRATQQFDQASAATVAS